MSFIYLSFVMLLLACGCSRTTDSYQVPSLIVTLPPTAAPPHSTNTSRFEKTRILVADDLRSAGIDGDLSALDIKALQAHLEFTPPSGGIIASCLTKNPPSKDVSVVKLEDSDYVAIAQLLRSRVVMVTQPPLISGRECSGVKIVKIATREDERLTDLTLVKSMQSGWQIVTLTRVVY